MNLKFLRLIVVSSAVLLLSSCTPIDPIVEEPVIVETPKPVPEPVIISKPEPTPIPDPEPVIVAPEPVVELPPETGSIPEPDLIDIDDPNIEAILEALESGEAMELEPTAGGPSIDSYAPDEVINGELTQDEAFDKIEIKDNKQRVRVFYGTNRILLEPDLESFESYYPEQIYGETPIGIGEDIHYGKAEITIPPRHKRGRLETPIAGEIKNERRYVVLKSFEEEGYDAVMAEVQRELDKAAARGDQKTLVAYVHGFNTSFEKAARRSGQLKFDLDYTGPFFFFSWPSKESAFGYTHAANLAEISYTAMTTFLKHLTDQDADRIIIIAHSMGTRVFSHGLVDLAAQDPEAAKKITKVILAAPDIDRRVFVERLLPKMSFLKNPITIYASDKDTALTASKEVNGLPRLGDVSGSIQELKNVVMIDASDVKSNMLNHTYFGDSVSIVDDFKEIVNGPVAAEFRKLLQPVGVSKFPKDLELEAVGLAAIPEEDGEAKSKPPAYWRVKPR